MSIHSQQYKRALLAQIKQRFPKMDDEAAEDCLSAACYEIYLGEKSYQQIEDELGCSAELLACYE